jgi:predicted NAD/FAD-binding protein
MAEYVTGQRERRRVAVVGAGVAGLTAAHVFASAGRHVTLYEADHRLGGHADTHLVDVGGRIVPVDTGSSSTTTGPTRRCCASSPSSASRRATPT